MASKSSPPQDLLDDLGRFLRQALIGESLSPKVEMERAGLLQRLQPYIRQSGNDVTSVPKNNTEKTEKNGTKGSRLEEDFKKPPAAVSSTTTTSSCSGRTENSVTVNLPFSELKSTAHKHGPLLRKEKGFFLDQWRKYVTLLHKHFLFMYSSEQGVRPFDAVNIKGFIARSVPNCKTEFKKDAIFEIVCPGKMAYQFAARTQKDMEQWVAAICQASVQYIQVSQNPLPQLPVANSFAISAENNPELADTVDVVYDDARPATCFSEKCEDIDEQYDEEFYHDISNEHQGNSGLESKTDGEVAGEDEHPPLPPRRPVPPVPLDDIVDQECEYDDVAVPTKHRQYSNMVSVDEVGRKITEIQRGSKVGQTRVLPGTGKEGEPVRFQPSSSIENGHKRIQPNIGTEGGPLKVKPSLLSVDKKAEPQQSVKNKMQQNTEEKNDEEEEVIYDDIEPNDEPPKAPKSPVLQEKHSIRNGEGIKNRVKILEECLFKDVCQPKPRTSNQFQPNMSTLPKLKKNAEKDTLLSLPQTSTDSEKSKSVNLNQAPKLTSSLYKRNISAEQTTASPHANTPLDPQPPELPPRSYLKR